MNIVVDSNIIAAVFLDTPYSDVSASYYTSWLQQDILLIAPTLFEYEITSLIRRYVKAGMVSDSESKTLIDDILSCDIQIIKPSRLLHHSALRWAKKIGQAKAYDAQYLALAEQENADFWSADKRLVNGLHQLNVDWVHWIGEE